MTDLKNGSEAIAPTVSKDCIDTAELLEGLARQARAGIISGVGIVTVSGPGNWSLAGTVNYLMEICLGGEFLKDHYKAIMMQKAQAQAGVQQARKPTIMRPPPGVKF